MQPLHSCELSSFWFMIYNTTNCSRHNSKVWCEMIFPIPLISSSTKKAMHVCWTARFPPTKYTERSLNIPMLYSRRTVGSLSIPNFINILIECFYHSPHGAGERILLWRVTVGELSPVFAFLSLSFCFCVQPPELISTQAKTVFRVSGRYQMTIDYWGLSEAMHWGKSFCSPIFWE